MKSSSIQAIDVHAHVGVSGHGERREMDLRMSGTGTQVVDLARRANIGISIASSFEALMPFGGDPLRGNALIIKEVECHKELRFWAVLHPTVDGSYQQVAELLKHKRCCGIKIHPDRHHYLITEHGDAIFKFSAKHQAVVLTHTGQYGSNPEDFIPFCDRHPEVRCILAHIGNDPDSSHRQTFACKRSKHGNVYADTSSSASMRCGLIESAVADMGYERILFGTDTPLYFPPAQRARIDQALISDMAKRAILFENASKLLKLS